jgi:SPW repeat
MALQYGGYYTPQSRYNRWQDWANVVLAVWLFISPWVLRFGAGTQVAAAGAVNGPSVEVSHAAWNAWVIGVIVFLVALSAIGSWEIWQEWWCLVLGAWIFAAPWALGFVGLPRASWDHWLVGAAIFLLALWGLSRLRNSPGTMLTDTVPPSTADRPPPPRRPVP